MAETLNTKVPSPGEVEELRDARDAAWSHLGDAQRVNNTSTQALRAAEAEYHAADDTYCAARKASGTTQLPR